MSTTFNQVYQDVCLTLLEPGGLVLGLIQPTDVLNYLGQGLVDLLLKTNIIRRVDSFQANSGIDIYSIQDNTTVSPNYRPVDIFYAAFNNSYLHQTSAFYLDNYAYLWAGDAGQPIYWKQDEIDPQSIQISPVPDPYSDTLPITVIGAAIPIQVTGWQLTDTIPLLPDSFTPALKYYALARIFGSDTEHKDLTKSAYCLSRYAEFVSIGGAIMNQEFQESAS